MWNIFSSTHVVDLPGRPDLCRAAQKVKHRLTCSECWLAGGRVADFGTCSVAHAHRWPYLQRCGRCCWAATSPPVVQEPTCNSYVFSVGGEIQEMGHLKLCRQTHSRNNIDNKIILSGSAEHLWGMKQVLRNDCLQLARILMGDSAVGKKKKDLEDMPPQMAWNKGHLQLLAPQQTTACSLCISSCGVHDCFLNLLYKVFYAFTRALKDVNAQER